MLPGTLHSTHAFMLPLRWDYLPAGYHPNKSKELLGFDARADMLKMATKLKATHWKRQFYRINNDPQQYNEHSYFHAYATYSLFDMQQSNEQDTWFINAGKTMVYFEIAAQPGDYYQVETIGGITYQLELSGLSLHVYNTGIAILSINLENRRYPDVEDVLRINEFGRRFYPPFLGQVAPYTQTTKNVLLPVCVELKCHMVNNGLPVREDFSQYDHLHGKETHQVDAITGEYCFYSIVELPNYIKALFNGSFVFKAGDEKEGDTIRLNILTDDRMFFQCWYGNNTQSAQLRNVIELYNNEVGFQYAQSAFWYAFMYGDRAVNKLGIDNKYYMEKELLMNTYGRWAACGTLYGFTRDSFVAISEELAKMKNYGVDIAQHFKTMYYQMAVLCLAQRASILRFSAEVAAVTKNLHQTKTPQSLERIQQLYLQYIRFTNTICFQEISPQMQGIEIYRQFRATMNIPDEAEKLDGEIQQLHDFAMLVEQKRAGDEGDKLSRIAAWFLPVSVITGFMGIGVLGDGNMHFGGKPDWNAWGWIAMATLLGTLSALLLLKGRKFIRLLKIKKNKNE